MISSTVRWDEHSTNQSERTNEWINEFEKKNIWRGYSSSEIRVASEKRTNSFLFSDAIYDVYAGDEPKEQRTGNSALDGSYEALQLKHFVLLARRSFELRARAHICVYLLQLCHIRLCSHEFRLPSRPTQAGTRTNAWRSSDTQSRKIVRNSEIVVPSREYTWPPTAKSKMRVF